jgi:cytochrome c556
MRYKNNFITISLVLGSLSLSCAAFAHGTNGHGQRTAENARMKKLHAIMPVFSAASAKLETAIEKGDPAEAKIQANRILAAVPDLKMSKPHKNIKQITDFKTIADKLGADITKIVSLTEQSNFAGAKVVFKNMEARCSECHTEFRD